MLSPGLAVVAAGYSLPLAIRASRVPIASERSRIPDRYVRGRRGWWSDGRERYGIKHKVQSTY
ncbi:hypothetical protein BDZ91DRAFT_722639 [Kalaharituber pfeilii]|nr:hypothetical protein BDZ91DRAFT_722639 [Kalaharituber pfeilii]